MSRANELVYPSAHSGDGQKGASGGLTIREFIAIHAMSGLLANSGTAGSGTEIAPLVTAVAVHLADGLLAELAKNGGAK